VGCFLFFFRESTLFCDSKLFIFLGKRSDSGLRIILDYKLRWLEIDVRILVLRKQGMKSSHYGPHMLGYTRAAMLNTIRYESES